MQVGEAGLERLHGGGLGARERVLVDLLLGLDPVVGVPAGPSGEEYVCLVATQVLLERYAINHVFVFG
eukprot:COSAG04_NODE_22054_length_362_cov_0.779468_1_plen_67_part_01